MAWLRPADQLVILADLQAGQKGAGNPERIRMDMDQHMGDMYPFSNAQKLQKITETTRITVRSLPGVSRWCL